MAKYIAEAIYDPLLTDIREADVISLFFHGATDHSVSEVEIMYCRYVKDGEPCDVFMGVEDLEHAHADGVFAAISSHGEQGWWLAQ